MALPPVQGITHATAATGPAVPARRTHTALDRLPRDAK